MRFEKSITIVGKGQHFMTLKVTDAECFEDCDTELMAEAVRLGPEMAVLVSEMLGKEKSHREGRDDEN